MLYVDVKGFVTTLTTGQINTEAKEKAPEWWHTKNSIKIFRDKKFFESARQALRVEER